jgi:hypothetical protein
MRKTLREYVQLLRERRIFTVKQSAFIDYVNLYIKDAKCYKIVLTCNQDLLNKAKKAGITYRHTIIEKNIPDNLLISPEQHDISKGQFMLQYVMRNRDINICPGENYYLDQLRKSYMNIK